MRTKPQNGAAKLRGTWNRSERPEVFAYSKNPTEILEEALEALQPLTESGEASYPLVLNTIEHEGFIVDQYVVDGVSFVAASRNHGPGDLVWFTADGGTTAYALGRKDKHYFLANQMRQKVKDLGEFENLGEAAIAGARAVATILEG